MSDGGNGSIGLADLSARQHRVESDLQKHRAEVIDKLDRVECKIDALTVELSRVCASMANILHKIRREDVKGPMRRWLERWAK